MTLAHFLLLVLIGIVIYLYGGLWLLTTIERWWNRRKRERMK